MQMHPIIIACNCYCIVLLGIKWVDRRSWNGSILIIKKNSREMHEMQCKYCTDSYVLGPQRIRAHLLGIKGQGVDKCKKASNDVK